MEVCLMRKWRDIWLVGLLSKCYKIMDRTSICATTLRRNIADLEKRFLGMEKKYTFSMEMYESMLKRMTNAEISIGLMRSRYETYPPQQFDLTVREEDAKGEIDALGTPIILGSHILGSPKPEGTLLERIETDPELSWESIQERINSVSWVDSLVGEEVDIAPQ